MELEQDVKGTRRLSLTFTTHHKVLAIVSPGSGGVARAIEDMQRYMTGCVNVDPASIRYEIEKEATTDGCSPNGRN